MSTAHSFESFGNRTSLRCSLSEDRQAEAVRAAGRSGGAGDPKEFYLETDEGGGALDRGNPEAVSRGEWKSMVIASVTAASSVFIAKYIGEMNLSGIITIDG
jgi:hypothetical protein